MPIAMNGKLEVEQPLLGHFLSIVAIYLLTGMILQVANPSTP